MLGREIVKGKQRFFILLQAFAGFWKFDFVTGDELIVGCQSCFAGRRQVHFRGSVSLLCPERFWAFYPGCWLSYGPSNVAGHGLYSSAEQSRSRAIRHRWPVWARRTGQAFELPKQFTPGLGALAITVVDR